MFLEGFILGAIAVIVIGDLIDQLTERRSSMSHYEISPHEREDEAKRDERDFGTAEQQREDEEGERHLIHDVPGQEWSGR